MSTITVNPERISSRIETLAGFTEPDRPWTRTAFSPLYMKAREWLHAEMSEIGLQTEIDAGGNLIGTVQGMRNGAGAIGLGSHIDTVPDGGRFDGIAGVVAALEVVQTAIQSGTRISRPLIVFDFLAEEPNRYGLSCVGSRAIAGLLTSQTLAMTCPQGTTLANGIARMGGAPEKLHEPLRRSDGLRAFLELHIEQGVVLEGAGADIGVVSGIVAIERVEVTLEGRADHSGTTPMARRKDALVAAALMIAAVEQMARASCEDGLVATVGKMHIHPNAANAVPGRVVFTLETRAVSRDAVRRFLELAGAEFDRIGADRGIGFHIKQVSRGKPVAMDADLRAILSREADNAGFATRTLPSGGGHDAAFMARLCPAAMVFIPCRDGRSHCPEEWASEQQVARGAQTLLNAVLALDKDADSAGGSS